MVILIQMWTKHTNLRVLTSNWCAQLYSLIIGWGCPNQKGFWVFCLFGPMRCIKPLEIMSKTFLFIMQLFIFNLHMYLVNLTQVVINYESLNVAKLHFSYFLVLASRVPKPKVCRYPNQKCTRMYFTLLYPCLVTWYIQNVSVYYHHNKFMSILLCFLFHLPVFFLFISQSFLDKFIFFSFHFFLLLGTFLCYFNVLHCLWRH